ncbi:MAG: DMT family transporter [Oscillospiraceae bacterium]|nr:DMT family transporter [Oscillospiraceae bacterium]
MKKRLSGSIFLLLATIIWGSAFVSQSVGMDHIGPYTFQAIRCAMAALGLLPFIWLFDRKKQDGKTFLSRFCDKRLWLAGICCAIPLCAAVNLQQVALIWTDAGKAGFLTAMYILFVPILGLFIKRRPSSMIPVCVVLGMVGLYFLSWNGNMTIATGDLLLLGCAVAFAVQILFVDHFAPTVDPLRLNCLQAGLCGIGSAIIMFCTETPTMDGIGAAMLPMYHAGFLSMGAAYSLQIIGQKHLDPAPASLIMSLESVFAAIFGWIILNEQMSATELLGCVLVFAAVILSQIPIKTKKASPV